VQLTLRAARRPPGDRQQTDLASCVEVLHAQRAAAGAPGLRPVLQEEIVARPDRRTSALLTIFNCAPCGIAPPCLLLLRPGLYLLTQLKRAKRLSAQRECAGKCIGRSPGCHQLAMRIVPQRPFRNEGISWAMPPPGLQYSVFRLLCNWLRR